MRVISLWIWSRSSGVMKVLCSSATVSCVTLSALCSIERIFATYSSRRRAVGIVVEHLDEGRGPLDDERSVLVEEREELALLRHEHGKQAHRVLPLARPNSGRIVSTRAARCGIVAA